MFCPNCGAQLPEESQFCWRCGMRLPDMERKESAAYDAETGAGEAGAAESNAGMTDETGKNTTGPSGISGQDHSGKSGGSGSGKRIAVILGIAAAVVILIVAANLLLGISGGGGIYTGDYDGLAELDEEHIVLDEETGIEYIDNTILVFTQGGLTDRQKRSIASSVDGVVIGEYEGMAGLLQIEVESSSLPELDELAADLEESDLVWFASYDFVFEDIESEEEENTDSENGQENSGDSESDVDLEQSGGSSSSETDGNWWMDAINVDAAWEEFGDSFGEVTIGVVDSGIETSLSDVEGKISFTSDVQEERNRRVVEADESNAVHGTTVAALIAADRDGIGIDGIADQAEVYFSSHHEEDGNTLDHTIGLILMETMEQADAGCRVINHSSSLLGKGYSQSYVDKTGELTGKLTAMLVSSGWDGLIVQSAGNEADDTENAGFWAAYKSGSSDLDDHIVIVTSAEESGTSYRLYDGHAYGDAVDLCAPGVNIIYEEYQEHLTGGSWGYGTKQGTSFAAPMVTAVAGLIWSADPDMTAAEVKSCLVNGYRFELTSSVSGDTYPMLDAYNAVQRALYCAFEGTVEYEDGTPAEGITVLAVDENGETLNDAVTDENGCYVINCSRLAVDHLSFHVGGEEAETLEIADEYREYDADAAKGDTESGYNPHDMEVVVLPLRQADIYVTGWDGTILEDAAVILTDSRGEEYEAAAQTDSSGSAFYQVFVPAGEYTIGISADDYESLVETAIVTANNAVLEYTLEEAGEISWDFNYDTGALTISGTGSMKNYTKLNYMTVPWYDLLTQITSVTICDGITSIGSYSFYSCVAVEEVTIAESVEYIGDMAFGYCIYLETLSLPDSCDLSYSAFSRCQGLQDEDGFTIIHNILYAGDYNLGDIVIPDGVTAIGACVMGYNYWSGSVTIPDTVTAISDDAFYCSGLTQITIPDSVTEIGDEAFADCYDLSELHIPSSVISIGDGAFADSGIETITIDSGNEYYMVEDGIILTKDGTTLVYCPESESGEFDVPKGVTTIQGCAFFGCSDLTNISLPESLIIIGNGAFSYCSGLTDMELPPGVEEIGTAAFYYCTHLESISIPDSVIRIGDGAFYECQSLTAIDVGAGNSCYEVEEDALMSLDGTKLLAYPAALTGGFSIPDGVTEIADYAFNCSDLTEIEIPDSVVSIGAYAFSQSSIREMMIPDSVTSMGMYCFFNSAIRSIRLSENLTTIEYRTFSTCQSLQSITIPGSVTSIGSAAFLSCDSLTEIVIPDNVTSIGGSAFYGCDNLASVTLSDGMSEIPVLVFENCENLTEVKIPSSITFIAQGAFYRCDALTDVYYAGSEGEWSNIVIQKKLNDPLNSAEVHYNVS